MSDKTKIHYEFYDQASERQMLLKKWHDDNLWLFYKHPDGQWVSLRKATDDDLFALGYEQGAIR